MLSNGGKDTVLKTKPISPTRSPIHARGCVQGFIKDTHSHISVNELNLKLDSETAWALCNLLNKDVINKTNEVCKGQRAGLIQLGKAIAKFVDHPNSK